MFVFLSYSSDFFKFVLLDLSMAGLSGVAFCSTLQEEEEDLEEQESLKTEILGLTSFSSRLERILLALLRQQETDRERTDNCYSQVFCIFNNPHMFFSCFFFFSSFIFWCLIILLPSWVFR